MAYSLVTYTSTGGQTYNVPFPYLDADHVKVLINGVETSAFTWSDGATIHLNDAPAVGAIILIKRETPRDGMEKSFAAQPRLKGSDLDDALLQAYYVGLEAMDNASHDVLQSYVDGAVAAQAAAELAETNAEAAESDAQLAQAAAEQAVIDAAAAGAVQVGLAEDARDAAVVAQGLAEDAADLAASYAGSAGAGTYMEVPSAPSTDANEVKMYAKDVTGVTELFIRKESGGAEIQVTSGSILNGTPPDASEGTKGIAELATQTETNAGTDDARIVTPAKLLATPMLNRKNLIDNGNFEVWQRGTTFTNLTGYGPDRWQIQRTVDGAVDVTQSVQHPTVVGAFRSLGVSVATPDAVVNGSQYCAIKQHLEGYTATAVWGCKAVLSFWVKSSVTGTYSIYLHSYDASRMYVAEYTVSQANTWEKKSIVLDLTTAISSGNWYSTTGMGMGIGWTLACGPDYQTSTLNQWQSGVVKAASTNQVNWCGAANTFFLSQVQLEVGEVATPYEMMNFGEEIQRCQRYFQKSYYIGDAPGQVTINGEEVWNAPKTGVQYQRFDYRCRMRATPTLTVYSTSTGTANRVRDLTGAADVTPSSTFGWEAAGCVGYTPGAIGNLMAFQWTASADL